MKVTSKCHIFIIDHWTAISGNFLFANNLNEVLPQNKTCFLYQCSPFEYDGEITVYKRYR